MLAVAAQVAGPAFSSRFVSTRSRRIAMAATSIADWPSTFENSLIKDLRKEETSQPFSVSRQVKGAHYTLVRPTVPAPAPELVVAAKDVAELIGICAEDVDFQEIKIHGSIYIERSWDTGGLLRSNQMDIIFMIQSGLLIRSRPANQNITPMPI